MADERGSVLRPPGKTLPQRRHGVTQADVAAAAGVSTASVSRVLNGSSLVRPEVRVQVQDAMDLLGYVPHSAARALALDRTGTIGAVIPTLSNAIFARGINAFERQLRQSGHTLLLSVSNYDHADETDHIRRLVERGVDGLLLVGNDRAEAALGFLGRAGCPVVCAWTFDEAAPFANVGFDNRESIAPAVDHLVGLGHTRIGMIAGVTDGNDRARLRVRGACDALRRHGLDLPPSRMTESPYLLPDARLAMGRLLDASPDLTAILCGNDVIAYGCLFEAAQLGRSVPGDLSLVGFDDLALSSHLTPTLTTVSVPAEEMGRLAAERLLGAVADRGPVRGERLSTKLVVRESTGPAG